jgi:hypothetical protein
MLSGLRFKVGLYGFLKGLGVYVPGKVNRAFTVDGIPSGRVRAAEKLNLKTHTDRSLFNRTPDNLEGRHPGGATGRTPSAGHGFNFTFRHVYFKLRGPELVAVFAQTILPGKSASGGWCGDTFYFFFFAGSHHGNALLMTQPAQVIGQIRVLEKVKYQVGIDVSRQKFPGIIDDRREGYVNGNHLQIETIFAVFFDAGDFSFTTVILLENQYFQSRITSPGIVIFMLPSAFIIKPFYFGFNAVSA